jgi:hypothetical protein
VLSLPLGPNPDRLSLSPLPLGSQNRISNIIVVTTAGYFIVIVVAAVHHFLSSSPLFLLLEAEVMSRVIAVSRRRPAVTLFIAAYFLPSPYSLFSPKILRSELLHGSWMDGCW